MPPTTGVPVERGGAKGWGAAGSVASRGGERGGAWVAPGCPGWVLALPHCRTPPPTLPQFPPPRLFVRLLPGWGGWRGGVVVPGAESGAPPPNHSSS